MGRKPLPLKTTSSPIVFPAIIPRSDNYSDQCRAQIVYEDQIVLFHNLFTPTNCRNFISFFQSAIIPLLSKPVAPKKGEATRTNERFSLDSPEFAQRLFHDCNLEDLLHAQSLDLDTSLPVPPPKGEARRLVGLNRNIRVYRYLPNTFFGPHYDDSVVDREQRSRSMWTLLIYFTSDDLEGGETSFTLDRHSAPIAPKIVNGMGLIHRHGHDCLLHEGLPVKKGIKWVLRSDLMYEM